MPKKRMPLKDTRASLDSGKRLADLEDRYESALLAKSLNDDRFLPLDAVAKRLPKAAH